MRIEWGRIRQLVALSAPNVVGMVSVTVSGLIGAFLVGRIGIDALAGVGVAGAIIATLSTTLLGLDTGVQAMVARMKGQGRSDEAGGLLVDAIMFSSAAGLVLCALAEIVGPPLLRLILHTPQAAAYGSQYLAAAAPSLLFVGAFYPFSAFWNAMGEPKYSLYVNLVTIVVGVACSSTLMFGLGGAPRLGVTGAGIGIAVANLFGVLGHLLIALKIAPTKGLRWRAPHVATLVEIARIGAPISAQQSLVNLGTAVWFAIIGMIGAREVGLANVFLRLENMTVYAAIGVGIGTATMVGWAMGAKDIANGRRWGWEGAMIGAAANVPVVAVALIAPQWVLGLFIQDPAVVAMGVWPLRIIAVTILIDTAGRILGFGMRGAGSTGYIASINFLVNWFLALPLAWVFGVQLGYGLIGVATSRICLVVLECLVVAAIWRSDLWTGQRVRRAFVGWRFRWPGRALADAAEL